MRPRARARVVERRSAEADDDDGCDLAIMDGADDSFVADILNRFTAKTARMPLDVGPRAGFLHET